jgi:hypothetical protein
LVILHMVERQVGLDKIVTASLGDEIFQRGSSLATQIGSDVVAWMRATLQI